MCSSDLHGNKIVAKPRFFLDKTLLTRKLWCSQIASLRMVFCVEYLHSSLKQMVSEEIVSSRKIYCFSEEWVSSIITTRISSFKSIFSSPNTYLYRPISLPQQVIPFASNMFSTIVLFSSLNSIFFQTLFPRKKMFVFLVIVFSQLYYCYR